MVMNSRAPCGCSGANTLGPWPIALCEDSCRMGESTPAGVETAAMAADICRLEGEMLVEAEESCGGGGWEGDGEAVGHELAAGVG